MAKENSNQADKSGTPTALLVSIVCAIIVFAMAEIKNSFSLSDTFALRSVILSYMGLGLAIAFFWKRLERSPFLKISGGLYLFGLWVSLFMTTLSPVLLKGEHVHAHLMQQFGFGFVAFSGLMLVVAMLQNQKMVPSLLFSALGAVALVITGGASLFVKNAEHDEGAISSHSFGKDQDIAADDDGEEITAQGTSLAAKSHGSDEDEIEEAQEVEKADAQSTEQAEEEHSESPDESHPATKADAHGKKGDDALDAMVREFKKDVDRQDGAVKTSPTEEKKSPKPLIRKEPKAAKKPAFSSLDHKLSEPAAKKSLLKSKGEPSWSYEAGPNSPERWGSIADEYRKCSVGQTQSPIDVPSAWPSMSDVRLDYKLTTLSIVDTGRTIRFDVGKQNTATIAGKRYDLVEFHMHTPSEHWIDGRSSPMEIHFVHKDAKGKLAILAVMVEAGAESKVFADMWGYVPQGKNLPASPRNKAFNISTLVPAKTKVYRYRGSDTTPPCDENVLWSIATQKMTLSKEQIEAFRMRYKNNARPIQKGSTAAH